MIAKQNLNDNIYLVCILTYTHLPINRLVPIGEVKGDDVGGGQMEDNFHIIQRKLVGYSVFTSWTSRLYPQCTMYMFAAGGGPPRKYYLYTW